VEASTRRRLLLNATAGALPAARSLQAQEHRRAQHPSALQAVRPQHSPDGYPCQGAHNNRAEGALRKAALGRKNILFVGHEAAGENLAGLYALVATCEANGVNPEEYLADVLLRVQTHPNSRIGELLPHEWKRRRAADSS